MEKNCFIKNTTARTAAFREITAPKELPVKPLDFFKEARDSMNHQKRENKEPTLIFKTSEFLEWRYLHHPFIKYNKHYIKVFNRYNIYIVWRIIYDDFWQWARIVDILYKEDVPESAMKIALSILMQCERWSG